MSGAEQPADSSNGADDSGKADHSRGGFVGGLLLIGSGIPIALLFGALSVFFAMSFLDQFQMEGRISWDMLGYSLLVSLAPLLFGLGLLILGIRLIRKSR